MLNLDTHLLIHALTGALTVREKRLLSEHPWSISCIVLWEMEKLRELGRIDVDVASSGFSNVLSRVRVWPLDVPVCLALRRLDFHSDPADEIIAATSIVHQVPLLTRDARIRRSRAVPLA